MARRNPLIAALLVAVLAGHALLLQWLASQAQEQAALRLMPTPMFTRLLQPQAPAPPPTPAPRPKPKPRRAPAVIESVTPSAPREITSTVAQPDAGNTPATGEPPATVATPAVPEDMGAREPPVPDAMNAAGPPAADTPTPTPSSATGTATSTAVASAPPSATATLTATATMTASSTATTSATAVTAQGAPATPAALDGWPGDTRLNYSVGGYYRGELHGNARVQWQRQGDRYQTRIDIDLGVITQVMTSQGEVTPSGLSPKAYEESRTGKRRGVALQDKQIVLSDGSQVPRPQGVQDTASQFVELSHRFASGQLALEVGRSVSFWMARPGGVDLWTYDVVSKEVLQTPQLGAVEAFHLKPRPLANPRGNITAEMWFAPSLQYLPVRIRVSMGDAHVDLFVEKIEQR